MGKLGRSIREGLTSPCNDVASAVKSYYQVAAPGTQFDLYMRAHAFGLIEGIADEAARKAYLEYILEPALAVISGKLSSTSGAPESALKLRAASIAVLSPLLMIGIHQRLLGGAEEAPLDSGATFDLLQTWLGEAIAD